MRKVSDPWVPKNSEILFLVLISKLIIFRFNKFGQQLFDFWDIFLKLSILNRLKILRSFYTFLCQSKIDPNFPAVCMLLSVQLKDTKLNRTIFIIKTLKSKNLLMNYQIIIEFNSIMGNNLNELIIILDSIID
ncbi:hypothetical protein BpHYR1_011051 [Brachionus plicatilis]|uniref:Uncharacterized protein n=1 Tax=Brachionus plicatilis TaxID=10195 RepID=A0A3M7PN58_BRAPC|nr:hypothetical protein BpHYR1_011051 [Brachionus plicatilis]